MVCVFFYVQKHPKGSIGSGSGFKAFQKMGPQLKVSDWEKPEIEPVTPGLQGGFCIYFYQTLIKYMKGFKSYRGFF